MTDAVLGARAIAQLKEIARRVLREEQGGSFGVAGRQHDTGIDSYVMKTTTGITGRSSNTVGKGTCQVYYRTTGDTLTQYSTNGVTVYNFTTHSIGAAVWIAAKQDNFGTLWIDTESCTST